MWSLLDTELSKNKIWIFYVAAIALFVFPILQANYLHCDDNARALSLGELNWRSEGRVAIEYLYHALSFSTGTPNLAPLAHLIAIPISALALRELAQHLFVRCTVLECIVILPLFYSPFNLGILIYQYDGPAIMLGISLIIFSFVFGHRPDRLWWLYSSVLMSISFSFSQLMVNVLLALYCVETADNLSRGATVRLFVRLLSRRCIQLAGGLTLYGLVVFPMMDNKRTALLRLDQYWLDAMVARMSEVADKMSLLATPATSWLWIGFLTCATLGYLSGIAVMLKRSTPMAERIGSTLIYLAIPLLLFLTVPGFTLLLESFDSAARVLLGLAPVCMAGLYFSHKLLTHLHVRAKLLLALPVFFMLSFSYVAGQTLSVQKELENVTSHALSHDMFSREELRGLEDIYLLWPEAEWTRLSTSRGLREHVPAMAYVLNWSGLIVPEQLGRAGLAGVKSISYQVFSELDDRVLIVSNKFYSIYRVGRAGYIQMKSTGGAEAD